jgi:hypothetical protein
MFDPIPAFAIWVLCGVAIILLLRWDVRRILREDREAVEWDRSIAEAQEAEELEAVWRLDPLEVAWEMPAREPVER